ncbi:MAG: hypothetical protein RLZZ214_3518, partial [Verrucomicrobiota bacterium]
PGRTQSIDLPYLGLEQVESQTGRILSRQPIEDAGSGIGTAFRFDSRHVLYSKLRPYLNKVALPEYEGRCSTELIPLLPCAGVDREYLGFLLRSPSAVAHASAANTGARMPRADMEHLFSWEVEVPVIKTQRQIASRLKGQMAAVQEARQQVEAQVKATESLWGSILADAIDCHRDETWSVIFLGGLLSSSLRTGISKQGTSAAKHRCLGLSAVRNGRLDLAASKPIDLTDAEAVRNRIMPGAFYVVRGNGNVRLVGRGAIAPEGADDNLVFPDLLIEVNPDPNLLDASYLRWAWDAPSVRLEIELRSMTSSGIYKINLGNLAQVPLPIPPLETQRRIAARLREQFEKLQQLKSALTAQLAALDKLPGAYLREAFGSLS